MKDKKVKKGFEEEDPFLKGRACFITKIFG
jgi:hypothetical protein